MEKIYIKEKKECSTMDEYLKPEFIYIPNGNNKYLPGDYIYKNDEIIDEVYSPISGYVRDSVYKYVDGKRIKYMVIENDYKEKYRKVNYIFNKREFLNTLKINKLIDVYDSYEIEYLVINAIDIEPYIFSKRLCINNYTKEILDIINNIMNRFGIYKCLISIVDNHFYSNLINYIGTYPNIKIIKVGNYYPVGNDRILLRELFGITYNKTSLEKKIWIIDLLSLLDIESIMKNGKIKNEKIITIGGSNIKNMVIRVKIGTSFGEIIKYLGGYKKSSIITIGGPLMGKQIDSDDVIITNDINAIFVTGNKLIREKICVLCGKCNSVCPVNLIPVFIMKNINNKNYLKKIDINKCIDCGLCSYICPSFINLKEYIIKAKEMINNE